MCNGPEPFEQLWKRTNQELVKFGRNPINGLGGNVDWKKLFTDACPSEEIVYGRTRGRTDAHTHGRTHNGQNVITKALSLRDMWAKKAWYQDVYHPLYAQYVSFHRPFMKTVAVIKLSVKYVRLLYEVREIRSW